MHLRFVFFACAVLVLFSTNTAFAVQTPNCSVFVRTLKQGSAGQDVLLLQKILNQQSATRIALSGTGSQGEETEYFGAKTKDAVIRLQELNKKDVLSPVGLTKGTGVVGPLTRGKLVALCAQTKSTASLKPKASPSPAQGKTPSTTKTSSTQKITTPKPGTQVALSTNFFQSANSETKPYLMYPAEYAVSQGGTLVIYGGGFSPQGNMIHVGGATYGGIIPNAKGELRVTIPSSASLGKFELWFSNTKGVSNKSFVVITPPGAVAPKVTSFTPKNGKEGAVITITGTGFSSEWNEIHMSPKSISGGKSVDGKTLSFAIPDNFPDYRTTPGATTSAFPVWFYVVNPSGVSNSSVFSLQL